MERETAMKILKELHNKSLFAERTALETIIPELKESEDERIRKALVRFHKSTIDIDGIKGADILAWLEKQGSQQPTIIWHSVSEEPEEMKELFCEWESDDATWHDVAFYDEESKTFRHAKMPINVTKWVYVDELLERQGEQKPAVVDFNAKDWYVSKVDGKIHDMTYNPADKVEPKFKVGDFIVNDYCMGRVVEITNDAYLLDIGQGISFSCEHNTHLWTIQDAKDGDVLVGNKGEVILMFRGIGNTEWDDVIDYHCYYDCCHENFVVQKSVEYWGNTENNQLKPATKKQRDTLFAKMKEAGYEWDAEKKELNKVGKKLTELAKGEDYGIDGLYVAVDILQKTLGEVDGYQTDDGILEHECAISAVKKLYEQNPTWSEEDENYLQSAENACEYQYGKNTSTILWLKSLKDRIICKNTI